MSKVIENEKIETYPKKTLKFIGSKKFLLIILALIISFIIYKVIASNSILSDFKNDLKTYISNTLVKDVPEYKLFSLSGVNYINLNLVFTDEFDNISIKDKYNSLSKLMEQFKSKRENLINKYNIQVPEYEYITITISTSKYKYEFNPSYFIDKDLSLYTKDEQGNVKVVQ